MTHMSFYVNFHQWNPASVPRVYKYFVKGFEVFVPAMDRSMFLKTLKRAPGVVNLIHVEKAFYGNYYINHQRRPDKDLVMALVRNQNYWGLRHQSAYEEYVGDRLQYVILTAINKGFQWLGLRPVGRRTNTKKVIAKEKCFHSTTPNFPGLYKFPTKN
jgi:hypothetical protein